MAGRLRSMVLCAALLCGAPVVATPAYGASGPGGAALPAAEAQAVALLNQLRATQGLAALAVHNGLTGVARSHSGQMAGSGGIFHSADLAAGAAAAGIDWSLLGENVGMGPTVESVHGAFEASSGHRKNMLDPRFTAVGVGVVASGGYVYVTQSFAAIRSGVTPKPPAPAPAPSAPAPTTPALTAAPPAPPAPPARPVATAPPAAVRPPAAAAVKAPATPASAPAAPASPTVEPAPAGTPDLDGPGSRSPASAKPDPTGDRPQTAPDEPGTAQDEGSGAVKVLRRALEAFAGFFHRLSFWK